MFFLINNSLETSSETLENGKVITRYGKYRMLQFTNCLYSNAIKKLSSNDIPITSVRAIATRHTDSGAYYTFAVVAIDTNGQIYASKVDNYNSSVGASNLGNNDLINGQISWLVK